MSEQGDDPNLRWWQLPGAWLSDQKLWRDVLTRVLAGVVTAAIVYAGAVVLGYLHTPELEAGALLTLGIGGGVLLVVSRCCWWRLCPRDGGRAGASSAGRSWPGSS